MKSSSYWFTRLQASLFDKTEAEVMPIIIRLYKKELRKLKKEVRQLYKDIEADSENGIVSITDLYRYDEYYKIANELNNSLTTIGESSIKVFEGNFLKLYENTQGILDKSSILLAKPSVRPEDIVNELWTKDNIRWSDRIWRNQELLQEKVMESLVDCFSRGVGIDQVVRVLAEDMNSGVYAARRLLRTEMNRIQNEATIERYKANGVRRYKCIEADDNKTCPICKAMNGRIFNIEDAVPGSTMSPYHPCCRGGVAPIVDVVTHK